MYKVILSENFTKEFYKLDKLIQERVRKLLKNLEIRLIGEPLKGDLKGFYSVHFERNKYRMIYYKDEDKIEVLVLHIGKRTDRFYYDFKNSIKNKHSFE